MAHAIFRRCCLPLILLAVLGACTVTGGADGESVEEAEGPAPLLPFSPQVQLRELWSRKFGNGQGRETRLQPALFENILYVAAHNGLAGALSAASGEVLWQYRAENELSGAVGVSPGLVLLGDVEGHLLALNRADGSLRWQRLLDAEILSPPAADAERVIVRTTNDNVFALAVEDGAELWTYESKLPLLTLRGASPPLLVEEYVFIGFDSGWLVALNPENGEEEWRVQVGEPEGSSPIDRLVDIDAELLLAGDQLYAVAYQSRLVSLDWRQGRVRWLSQLSSLNRPALGFGNAYVTTEQGLLMALDRDEGRLRWQKQSLRGRLPGPPVALLDYLAIGDEEGWLHLLSQVDGSVAARLRHGRKRISATPLVRGDVVYVLGDGGKIGAYRAEAL